MQSDRGTSKPVSQRLYTTAMKHYNWAKNEINKLSDCKVICSSHSSWSALFIIVPNGNAAQHLIIDCRALNKVTWKLVWTMPQLRTFSQNSMVCNIFSTLNLYARYHDIPLNEDSIPKTAFTSHF